MSRSTRTRCLAAGLAAAALAAAGAGIVSAATTGTDPCGNPVTFVQPFTSFGDSDVYVAVPGGSFEPSAPKFTLTGGAAVAKGNESYYVNSKSAGYSLSMPAGSTASSPAMCIDRFYPTFRMFGLNSGSASSTLRVDMYYKNSAGNVKTKNVGSFTASGTWKPSPILAFDTSGLGWSKATMATFVLTVVGSGSWKVDDLYVDPTKHR